MRSLLLVAAPVLALLPFSSGPLSSGPLPSLPTSPAAAPARKVTIQDAAWLAGRWEGELFGARGEEQWAAPAGGAMMGMFRLVRGEAVDVYEFCLIREDPEHGLVLRLKHFHPDLVGWEEQAGFVEFPLLAASEDELAFDGLVMRRAAADRLACELTLASGGGTQVVEFEYRRAE